MRIATVAVYVENQEAALKFWTEKLGFVVHSSRPMTPEVNWLEVGPQGAESRLVLYPKSLMKDWNERKPSVVFVCEDLNGKYEEMSSRGVVFTQPPAQMPWGPFAIFLDNEGNWFGLREQAA